MYRPPMEDVSLLDKGPNYVGDVSWWKLQDCIPTKTT